MRLDLFNSFELMFNNILLDNPDLFDEIQEYKGSVLYIELLNTKTHLTITIVEKGIEISEEHASNPDLIIRATPFELLNYFKLANQKTAHGSGKIEISGNISLAQRLQTIIVRLSIDWEEILSELIGDELSHSFGFIIKKISKNVRYAKKEFLYNVAEYIKYENDVIIKADKLNLMNRSIDQLRDDVERLNFRINRLSPPTEGG